MDPPKRKPLYMGKCLVDLDDKVGTTIASGPNMYKTVEKIMNAGLDAFRDRDEERAYVLLMRVSESLMKERTRPNVDIKYFDSLYLNTLNKAMNILEELKSSLESRYQQQKIERDSKNDQLPNGKANSLANNKDNGEYFIGDTITPKELHKTLVELSKNPKRKILLVDIRHPDEFNQSHIDKLPSPGQVDMIHVRDDWLMSEAVKDSSSFETCVSLDDLPLLKKRNIYDDIIIFDNNSKELIQNSSLNKTFSLIWVFSKSAERPKRKPIILEGGYEEWLLTYPTYVSSVQYEPKRTTSTATPDNLEDIYKSVSLENHSNVMNGVIVNGSVEEKLPVPSASINRPSSVQQPVKSIAKSSLYPVTPVPTSNVSIKKVTVPDRSNKPKDISSIVKPTSTIAETEFKLRKIQEAEEEMKRLDLDATNSTKISENDVKQEEPEKSTKNYVSTISINHPVNDFSNNTRFRSGDRTLSESSDSFKMTSNLSRSYSSPNIAKLNQIDESDENERPSFDRKQKPVFPKKPVAIIPFRHRDFAPIYSSNQKALGVTGLRNLGNTCFMNAVIQCLSNTPGFVEYFVSDDSYQSDINVMSKFGSKGELPVELAELFKKLWSQQIKSISPKDFRSSVSKHMPLFVGFEQQDSHEFFTMLLEKLHADLNRARTISPAAVPDPHLDTHLAAKKFWENHTLRNQSIVSETFEGLLLSTLRCKRCATKSDTFETFTCLSLPIPSSFRCTLNDCLRTFTEPEELKGESLWDCTTCKSKQEAIKHIQICRLPKILVIHLKRFSYEGLWRQKLSTPVDFPLDDLDVSHFVYVNQSYKPKYELFGIVSHFGNLEGGHYTATCKNHNRRWYKFDDNEVTEVNQGDIRGTSAAYILFYRKLESSSRL